MLNASATKFSAMAPLFTPMSPLRILSATSSEYMDRRSPVSRMYTLKSFGILLSSSGSDISLRFSQNRTIDAMFNQSSEYP